MGLRLSVLRHWRSRQPRSPRASTHWRNPPRPRPRGAGRVHRGRLSSHCRVLQASDGSGWFRSTRLPSKATAPRGSFHLRVAGPPPIARRLVPQSGGDGVGDPADEPGDDGRHRDRCCQAGDRVRRRPPRSRTTMVEASCTARATLSPRPSASPNPSKPWATSGFISVPIPCRPTMIVKVARSNSWAASTAAIRNGTISGCVATRSATVGVATDTPRPPRPTPPGITDSTSQGDGSGSPVVGSVVGGQVLLTERRRSTVGAGMMRLPTPVGHPGRVTVLRLTPARRGTPRGDGHEGFTAREATHLR